MDVSREEGGGGGEGGGLSERSVHGTFLVTNSICEPSLIKLIHDDRTH